MKPSTLIFLLVNAVRCRHSISLPNIQSLHFSVPSNPLKLHYSIQRQGRSALRSLGSDVLRTSYSKNSQALFLLLEGHGDAAHEILLGVNATNIEEAEYAATHPGQTPWQKEHPLDDVNDLIHSFIHRCEGTSIGEGGHSGFENSKFWAAGGPKRYFSITNTCVESPSREVIHRALAIWTEQHTPACFNLVVPRAERRHQIIAGGGALREVCVKAGCWDPFAFIDLCAAPNQSPSPEELYRVQDCELRLLLAYELITGESPKMCDAETLLKYAVS